MRSILPIFKGMDLHLYLRYLAHRNEKLPIELDAFGRMVMIKEWPEWELEYIPQGGLKGKRVLDVGCGRGETAYFFFQHGASYVFGIDRDLNAAAYFMRNAAHLNWNCGIAARPFALSDLVVIPFDFMKVDIEGGERILLSLTSLPPCAIEIHSLELAKAFQARFPQMKITKKYHWPLNTWMGKIG